MEYAYKSLTGFADIAAESDEVNAIQCQICMKMIGGEFYVVEKRRICLDCVHVVKDEMTAAGAGSYPRALAMGAAAALAGLVVYAVFRFATGFSISYIALAVGWMVGMAMRVGAKGVSGTKFAITAVALTYLAISMAYVPIWIGYSMHMIPTPINPSKLLLGGMDAMRPTGGDATSQNLDSLSSADGAIWVAKLFFFALFSPILPLVVGHVFGGGVRIAILSAGLGIAAKISRSRQDNITIAGPFKPGDLVIV